MPVFIGVFVLMLAVIFLVFRLPSGANVPGNLAAAARKREKNSRRKARESSR